MAREQHKKIIIARPGRWLATSVPLPRATWRRKHHLELGRTVPLRESYVITSPSGKMLRKVRIGACALHGTEPRKQRASLRWPWMCVRCARRFPPIRLVRPLKSKAT